MEWISCWACLLRICSSSWYGGLTMRLSVFTTELWFSTILLQLSSHWLAKSSIGFKFLKQFLSFWSTQTCCCLQLSRFLVLGDCTLNISSGKSFNMIPLWWMRRRPKSLKSMMEKSIQENRNCFWTISTLWKDRSEAWWMQQEVSSCKKGCNVRKIKLSK